MSIPPHASDYIRTYDAVLSQEACADLIERFEQATGDWVHQQTPGYSFTEMNLTRTFPAIQPYLEPLFLGVGQLYAQEIDMERWWPAADLEAIRMKRYQANLTDAFPPHLDATDLNSCRRFLVMFLYLNDVVEGGETAFPQWDIAVRPKAGRLLVFPPHYPYVHEGRKPISGPKYILGSYLHFTHGRPRA